MNSNLLDFMEARNRVKGWFHLEKKVKKCLKADIMIIIFILGYENAKFLVIKGIYDLLNKINGKLTTAKHTSISIDAKLAIFTRSPG